MPGERRGYDQRSDPGEEPRILDTFVEKYSFEGITAGVNGQIRTLRNIIRMMVDLMEPSPDEVICENCTTSLIRVEAA